MYVRDAREKIHGILKDWSIFSTVKLQIVSSVSTGISRIFYKQFARKFVYKLLIN